MAKPKLARSAALHLRIRAFGVLFVVLTTGFDPLTAYILAMWTTQVLAKL